MQIEERKVGFVDERGTFHCPCGRTHGRGPIDAVAQVYRCLGCGAAYRVRGVVELRGPKPHQPEVPHE